MAGLLAEIEVHGVPIVRRRLLRFADRAMDATSAWEGVARILRRAVGLNFETYGAYGGSPWRALKPATRARKLREGLDPRILRATGRLFESFVNEASPDHIYEPGPQEFRWGSRVPYGVYHQSRAPRTKIPYRPPVRLNEVDRRGVVRELQQTMVGE